MRVTKFNTKINRETNRPYLVKEIAVNYPQKSICNPKDIFNMMENILDMSSLTEEYMYMICMNTKGSLIGMFEISHGNVNSSLASNREIFMKALLCGAVSIILVHNHPSGDPTPSNQDFYVTRKVKDAGAILGINIIDHIIIGNNVYYSMMENKTI